jgi:hypothetical protein
MQRGCTAAQSAVTEGGALECPVLLGEKFENVGFGGFSKTHTIVFGRRLAPSGDRLNSLQAPADAGCGRFEGFHRAEGDRGSSTSFSQSSESLDLLGVSLLNLSFLLEAIFSYDLLNERRVKGACITGAASGN